MKAIGARRWWALAALVLSVMAIGLDATVLSLALPTLANSLHASESQLQWFVTAYGLALAAAMLPAGLLGDRYGSKKVMLAALLLFGAASIGCAFSPTPEAFIAARVVLGIAGAALVVMSLSVVTVLFAEAERPRAMGIWAAGNFLSMPLGPIVGGWMLAHFWWGWVFLMNVPVIVVGLVAVAVLIPQVASSLRPKIDILGILLSSAGLALIMYAVTEAPENGWGSSSAIVPGLLGLGAIAAFVGWEGWLTRRPNGQPLIDLGLFRSRSFSGGIVLCAIGIFGMFGVLFVLPQFMQAIMGLDAQGAGVRFLPAIAGMVVGAIPADRVARKLGIRVSAATGLAVLGLGLLWGSTISVSSGDAFDTAWTFVVGCGAGMALATAASAAIVELPVERSGVGSALMQAIIKLGPAFGATILGSTLNATYQAHVAVSGLPAAAASVVHKSVFGGLAVAHQIGSPALADSARNAFVLGAGDANRLAGIIALIAVPLALVALPRRLSIATETAEATDSTRATAAQGSTMES